MEIVKYCPYFQYERWINESTVLLKCEAGTITFPSKEARRGFVYPLCASISGFKKCPLCQMMDGEFDKKTDAK